MTSHAESPSLADQLRAAFRESGLSVRALAIAAGVDQSTLNKFLTGSRENLRLDVAGRLFRVLGLKVVRDRRRRTPVGDAPPAERPPAKA